MFAGFEAILTLGVAAGGLLAPLIIELLGLRARARRRRPRRAARRGREPGPRCAGSTRGMRVRDADIEILRARRHAARAPGGDDRAARRRARARASSRPARRSSSRASTASASTSSSPARPRWSATGTSSRRSRPATASARSPSCSDRRGRPPCAPPRGRALRVSVLQRSALPDRRDRLPRERGRAGEQIVTTRLEALDAGDRLAGEAQRAAAARSGRRRSWYRMPRPRIPKVAPRRSGREGSEAGAWTPRGPRRRARSCARARSPRGPARSPGPGGASRARAAVERLGEQDVLRHLHGVLEQAVDVDHVHADEVPAAPDRLDRDLPDVRHELQLQVARARAAPAGAHVELDEPPLGVEGAVHGDRDVGDGRRASRRRRARRPRATGTPRRPRSRSARSLEPRR